VGDAGGGSGSYATAVNGVTNTGGGGGGAGTGQQGGNGGSGFVFIRYPITFANAVTTGIYSNDATYRYFTFYGSGSIIF
jgi:hypothetical protein